MPLLQRKVSGDGQRHEMPRYILRKALRAAIGSVKLKYIGGCHCGNIQLTFESDLDPRQIKVRSCQCSFCRKHGSRVVSDPNGALTVKIADEEHLQRYMFAHHTAEFLICRCCGVYVAAVTIGPDQPRAVAQLNASNQA